MRTQAIFLSLIILFSLFVAHGGLAELNNGAQQILSAGGEPERSFTNDLSNALSGKLRALSDSAVVLGSGWQRILGAAGGNVRNSARDAEKRIVDAHNSVIQQIAESSLKRATTYEPQNALSEIRAEPGLDTAPVNTVPQCNSVDYSSLDAQAYFAKYLDSNTPLIEKSIDKRWPIASVTKLMTAVVAREKLDPGAKVAIDERSANAGGASSNFKAGEVFRVKDLLQAMLVVSSNNAAVALSQKLGETGFVNEMQKKAYELKMYNTSYLEPTGLSFVNQSTVADLTKLITYIYYYDPEILQITRQPETEILELKSGQLRKLTNIDAFAGDADFIGGKTGFTDEAGRNLLALFKDGNRVLLTAVLGSQNSFAETKKLKDFVSICKLSAYGNSR